MKKTFLCISLLLLIIISACGKKHIPISPDERFTYAKKRFEDKKYDDALEVFRLIAYSQSDLSDDAEYMIGECYFNKKDYLLAITHYRIVTHDYPSSPWADDAQYKIGLSYYEESPSAELDQSETHSAITEFDKFIRRYTASPLLTVVDSMRLICRMKLAEKEYRNGYIYYKLEEYNPSILYLNELIIEYQDCEEWIAKSHLLLGKCYIKEKQWEEAISEFQFVISNYNENYPKIIDDARKELEKANKEKNKD